MEMVLPQKQQHVNEKTYSIIQTNLRRIIQ